MYISIDGAYLIATSIMLIASLIVFPAIWIRQMIADRRWWKWYESEECSIEEGDK